MKEKITRWLQAYGRLLTGLAILLCVAGLAVSYMKPKQKLETVAINMGTEGESTVPLKNDESIRYVCDTKGYPMAGIQVGVTKNGYTFTDMQLICSVYDEAGTTLLSRSGVTLAELDEGQYVYIPFDNYKQCIGTLTIEFTVAGGQGEYPGLFINSQTMDDAATYVNGELLSGNLKSYYIYKLDYYPLLFDLCTALLLFVGVFFLTGRKKDNVVGTFLLWVPKSKKEAASPVQASRVMCTRTDSEVVSGNLAENEKTETELDREMDGSIERAGTALISDEIEKTDVTTGTAVSNRHRRDMLCRRWPFLAGLAAAVVVVLLEIFYFNQNGLKYGTYQETYRLDGTDDRVDMQMEEFTSELDEQTAEDLRYQDEMNRLYYELLGAEYESTLDETLTVIDGKTYKTVSQAVVHIDLGEAKFVRQMQFSYPVDESKYASYGVEARFYKDGKLLNDYLLYDTVNSRIDTGYMNVSLLADSVELITYGDFAFEGTGVTTSFRNDFQFNWYRVIFLIGTAWMLLFLLCQKKLFIKRLEVAFAIVCLWFGGCMVILVGSNQSGWDEHIHFLKAYEASFGSTIETPEAAMGMRGKYNPEFASLTERRAVTKYLRDNDDLDKADISYQSKFIGYSTRAYLPQAIGLKVARALHLPFDWQYMAGKFGNLVFYILVLMLAIRISRSGKKFIALLGMMPTPLFLASEYTYDAFITAFLFLGFVLWVNEIQSEEKLTWYRALVMMGCFVAGSWSKQIYIFMMLLLVFLPRRKFNSRVSEWVFKGMTVACVLLILTSIFSAPGAAKTLAIGTGIDYDFSTAGDRRVQGVSMMGQIQYILANPLTYTVLLLKSIARTAVAYTLCRFPWLDLAYCGIFPAAASFVTAVLLLLAGFVREKGEDCPVVGKWYKLLLAVMIFGVVCVIWTSLYGTFSVVGAAAIDGVQARYYIPLMLPFLYLFGNRKLVWKGSRVWYYRVLFLGAALLNGYGIYQYILKATLF